MKRFLLAAFFAFAAPAGWAAPVPYELLQEDSSVGFTWFLGTEAIEGRMPVKRADVVLDFNQLNRSKVSVAVDVANAQAGFVFATQVMKGPSVLWVDRFPEITFESTDIRRDGQGAQINGLLTVRGVTRPVVFEARLFRPSGAEEGDLSRLTIRLTGTLSRKSFGATGWSDLAGDEVRLSIAARLEEAE